MKPIYRKLERLRQSDPDRFVALAIEEGFVDELDIEDGADPAHQILDLRVADEQYDIIKADYGKKTADAANYGWGSSEGSYATKIYQQDVRGIESNYDPDGPIDQVIDHDYFD